VTGEPIGFATLNGGTVGGKAGQTVTVKTFADLKQYASASSAYVILIDGTISNGTSGGKVSITSNKSLVGIGSTAFLQGIGLEVASSNNVIIQNLKITLVGTSNPGGVNGGDAIAVNGTSKNVWIDHCELYSEDPTVQTNIDKYDGLIDIRDQTGFVTVSWNYIHDHHKTSLVGSSDQDIYVDRKITYHHNYFRQVVKRAPAEYRGAVGHFFNNYIVGIPTTEASFLLVNTCVRIEKSVYENVKYAIYTEASGTKGKAERIDNIASQSRAWPPDCTADISYEYKSALTTTTSDVKTVVPAGAGVGKL
jgi:pectate lyase